ncbi:glutamine amidotransferase [Duganella sp. Leaf126]|uniref:type 1 glutamine amidotransferase domain-containing protein n=1 Tax=Duganella sp. Leaf126 TaxID=1736266 RepID=UPI00070083CE|nr:type 1 glutamine amidotransferase domain-containing protein [Duganella sp. Leaf126]KQQ31094.1 glutamine amidotransferase [Duganella sp. Leaf126]
MNTSNHDSLSGKRIAILMTDGVEQVEYEQPRAYLEQHGAQVTLMSPKAKGDKVQGFEHLTASHEFTVELDVKDAQPGDYDALVLPGGVANPDALRLSEPSIGFIRDFGASGKPIAAICHGPWTLIDAGLVDGRKMTSWPSLKGDLRNAGAAWEDAEVVVDKGLVTSRKPDDIPAFNRALQQQLLAA